MGAAGSSGGGGGDGAGAFSRPGLANMVWLAGRRSRVARGANAALVLTESAQRQIHAIGAETCRSLAALLASHFGQQDCAFDQTIDRIGIRAHHGDLEPSLHRAHAGDAAGGQFRRRQLRLDGAAQGVGDRKPAIGQGGMPGRPRGGKQQRMRMYQFDQHRQSPRKDRLLIGCPVIEANRAKPAAENQGAPAQRRLTAWATNEARQAQAACNFVLCVLKVPTSIYFPCEARDGGAGRMCMRSASISRALKMRVLTVLTDIARAREISA